MICLYQLYIIMTQFSLSIFSHYYAIFLKSNKNFQMHFILKLMAKLINKTIL